MRWPGWANRAASAFSVPALHLPRLPASLYLFSWASRIVAVACAAFTDVQMSPYNDLSPPPFSFVPLVMARNIRLPDTVRRGPIYTVRPLCCDFVGVYLRGVCIYISHTPDSAFTLRFLFLCLIFAPFPTSHFSVPFPPFFCQPSVVLP